MTLIPLDTSASAVANLDGYALIVLGPNIMGTSWRITSTSVQNDGKRTPIVAIYRGAPSPTSFLEGTDNGLSDTSDSTFSLRLGDTLSFEFKNADSGSNCFVVLTGTLNTGR